MTIPREAFVRKCTTCGETKPIVEFVPKSKSQLNGDEGNDPLKKTLFRCKKCYNEYHKFWRAEQGERYRKQQRDRFHERRAKLSPDELKVVKERDASKTRARFQKIKDLVYRMYGGYKCACCGETEPSFLTIDHKNNDGNHMRKHIHGSSGSMTLDWLIKNKFPEGYQIFCWNCQWGKVKNNGICPHQKNP